MQVNQQIMPLSRLSVLILLLIGTACQVPRPVTDNPYERDTESSATDAPAVSKPVQQLHNQALAAINEDQYALATDYLQRAIRIEPRNGWSWHYLADIHWRQGDYERCRSMLDRSVDYAAGDSGLTGANREMRARCR